MDKIILQDWVMKKIKSEGMLYGSIAANLKISPTTLPKLLMDNDPRLTQAEILRILRNYLKVKSDKHLLTQEKVAA